MERSGTVLKCTLPREMAAAGFGSILAICSWPLGCSFIRLSHKRYAKSHRPLVAAAGHGRTGNIDDPVFARSAFNRRLARLLIRKKHEHRRMAAVDALAAHL